MFKFSKSQFVLVAIAIGMLVSGNSFGGKLSAGTYALRGAANYLQCSNQTVLRDGDKSVCFHPDRPGGYLVHGFIRLKLSEVTDAVSNNTKGIQLNPKLLILYVRRDPARLRQGDILGAMKDNQTTLKLGSSYMRLYLLNARIRQAREKLQKALINYQSARGQCICEREQTEAQKAAHYIERFQKENKERKRVSCRSTGYLVFYAQRCWRFV